MRQTVHDSVASPRVDTRSLLVDHLTEARLRTLEIISTVSTDDLFVQHDPLMSPIAWDLGHIGNFEELWGVRPFAEALRPDYDGMYDAMRVPRAIRDKLPLPALEVITAFLSDVRTRLLECMEGIDLDADRPLTRDGYVWRMILQHEYQHNETMLQTLQLKKGDAYRPARRRALPSGNGKVGGMVTVPDGTFRMGTDDRSRAYDNERPAHDVELPAFEIDVAPVTNGEYLSFMQAGAYEREELWRPEGWTFIRDHGLHAPKYWECDAEGQWWTRTMDLHQPLNPRHPVVHVNWYEADAYARFLGKRLPTEAEWEKAASWNPASGATYRYPWGDSPPGRSHANLDHHAWGTSEVGAFPGGVSPVGCHHMIGDVWEWTATVFGPYDGFVAFPYDEYSQVFFGTEYRVLRGGSWATRPGAIRNTFRNWDYPIRRQIFAGFRCARDV